MTNLLRFCTFLGTLGAATLLAAQSPSPTPATASVASGFDFSQGDYGFTDDTEVYSIPLDLSYERGRWVGRASFSYLTINGPATIIGGGGAARPTSNTESGVGDVYLSGTYRFGETLGKWNLDATLRLKLPTADEDRGLGTGEFDAYGQVDLYRTFGKVTPFLALGYREFGTNDLYQLHSGIYTSVGAHFRTSEKFVVITAFNWGEHLLEGQDDTMDAFVAVNHEAGANWRVMAYALTGFTDASPNLALGGRVTYRF
jgi:hypothetical protein